MVVILGVTYITDKEAAQRYGYSVSWFQKLRMKKESPKFIKLRGKGKVLYPIDELDQWFRQNLQASE